MKYVDVALSAAAQLSSRVNILPENFNTNVLSYLPYLTPKALPGIYN